MPEVRLSIADYEERWSKKLAGLAKGELTKLTIRFNATKERPLYDEVAGFLDAVAKHPSIVALFFRSDLAEMGHKNLKKAFNKFPNQILTLSFTKSNFKKRKRFNALKDFLRGSLVETFWITQENFTPRQLGELLLMKDLPVKKWKVTAELVLNNVDLFKRLLKENNDLDLDVDFSKMGDNYSRAGIELLVDIFNRNSHNLDTFQEEFPIQQQEGEQLLNVTLNKFEHSSLVRLFQRLLGLDQPTRIVFNFCLFDADAPPGWFWCLLDSILQENGHIEKVAFLSNVSGHQQIKMIANLLNNQMLDTLLISAAQMEGRSNYKPILKSLSENRSLQTLRIDFTAMSEEEIRALFDYLPKNESIEQLHLTIAENCDRRFIPLIIECLKEYLICKHQLKSLTLHQFNLAGPLLKTAMSCLVGSSSLKTFILDQMNRNGVEDEFYEALKLNFSIVSSNLRDSANPLEFNLKSLTSILESLKCSPYFGDFEKFSKAYPDYALDTFLGKKVLYAYAMELFYNPNRADVKRGLEYLQLLIDKMPYEYNFTSVLKSVYAYHEKGLRKVSILRDSFARLEEERVNSASQEVHQPRFSMFGARSRRSTPATLTSGDRNSQSNSP